MSETIIELKGVNKWFGDFQVLKDVNLEVGLKQKIVVCGPSGSGKSTLIRHINRLIDPTEGEVLVDGVNVLEFNEKELLELRRHEMSMVFQRFGLFPHKTVKENVAYGLEVQDKPLEERNQTAEEQIKSVGLSGFEHQYPNQLSGGMQQRVGLARALATNPGILLMDEAFSALDPLIRNDMQDQLVELQSKLHKTIVFITHDLDESLKLGDHIGILNDGKLVQVGKPEEIIMNPADDYVAAFVKDVNRAKVLRAKTIMLSPEKYTANGKGSGETYKVLGNSFIEEFLPLVLEKRSVVEVIDKDGNNMGFITEKELAQSLSKT